MRVIYFLERGRRSSSGLKWRIHFVDHVIYFSRPQPEERREHTTTMLRIVNICPLRRQRSLSLLPRVWLSEPKLEIADRQPYTLDLLLLQLSFRAGCSFSGVEPIRSRWVEWGVHEVEYRSSSSPPTGMTLSKALLCFLSRHGRKPPSSARHHESSHADKGADVSRLQSLQLG